MNRWIPLWAVLLLVACGPAGPQPECGEELAFARGDVGAFCSTGPGDCAEGLACVQGRCAEACDTGDQCPDHQGCRSDGTCGACAGAGDCRDGESCDAGVCVPPVLEWNLTVAEADWQTLRDRPYRDDVYPCTLEADGEVFAEGCTVRSYGSTARVWPKVSLRVRFPEGASHPGYSRKITLRAEYNDPTYLRNHLAYETFERLTALPTPRTRHVFLQINGADYGLFVEQERPGGAWLERNGRDRSRSLYEAEHSPVQGALVPFASHDEYVTIDDDLMFNKKTGDPDDYSDLIALVEQILWSDFEASPSRTGTVLDQTRGMVDVETHMEYLALMALVQNRDHVASNYNIGWQYDSAGLPAWEVYPLDLDTTFGCVFHEEQPELRNQCTDNLRSDVWPYVGVADAFLPVGPDQPHWMNMLAHLSLNESGCRGRFESTVCAFASDPWWSSGVSELAASLAAGLRPYIERDLEDLNADVADFDSHVALLRQFPVDRAAYLATSFSCP